LNQPWLRTPEGKIELRWPLIKELRPEPVPGGLLVHKFTAYAYNRDALEYLTGVNPHNLLVLCVRDPARALVSWHRMHRTIAQSERNPSHFAWKERDFYAQCTLSEYYRHYAQRRLRYDRHLSAILNVVPKARLAVVSQERMAEGIARIGEYLVALARGMPAEPPAPVSGDGDKHEGYADKAQVELDEVTAKELHGVRRRLLELVAAEVTHRCV
jgi:hypothetical protein